MFVELDECGYETVALSIDDLIVLVSIECRASLRVTDESLFVSTITITNKRMNIMKIKLNKHQRGQTFSHRVNRLFSLSVTRILMDRNAGTLQ